MKNTIVESLINILQGEETNELTKAVIKDILSDCGIDEKETDITESMVEDLKSTMKDIVNYGCISGTVSSLVYYSQTKEFFITHMDDIFELYNELKNDMGSCPLGDKELEYNILSWFAYEQVTYRLLNDLEF